MRFGVESAGVGDVGAGSLCGARSGVGVGVVRSLCGVGDGTVRCCGTHVLLHLEGVLLKMSWCTCVGRLETCLA